jgi:hypothetical protein
MAKKYYIDINVRNDKNQTLCKKSMALDIERYKEAVRIFNIG